MQYRLDLIVSHLETVVVYAFVSYLLEIWLRNMFLASHASHWIVDSMESIIQNSPHAKLCLDKHENVLFTNKIYDA